MNPIVEKKILIISHNSLSLHSNNGKTLASIFSAWDAENIAQLYFQEEIPESEKFHKFFRLRDIDVLKRLFHFGGGGTCGDCVEPLRKVASHYEKTGRLKSSIISILRKLSTTKLLLRDIIYGTGLWQSSLLNAWLKNFDPDSIFFVGGNSIFSFNIAVDLANTLQIPMDIYITDDYILNSRGGGPVSNLLSKKLFRTYQKSFNFARNVFVIGDDMALSFSRVFERDFIPVMNSVFFSDFFPRNNFELKNPGCVDIVYAGGLHLGRDQSLVNFGEIIKLVSSEAGLDVKLSVFSMQSLNKHIARHFSNLGIFFGGSLDHDKLQARLQEADFVLHVESFNEKYIAVTKLSVSTKIPEYFASGACLIAYGPSELASIRLIGNNLAGICITEKSDLDHIEKTLIEIFSSEQKRESLSKTGFDFGKSKFDAVTIRVAVAKLLNE